MKFIKFIIIISSHLIINKSFSQCTKNQNFDTAFFLKKLSKKTDTIYFRATLINIGKMTQDDYINMLSSKKLIKKKNYTTGILFVPLGSTQELYLPINDIYNEEKYEKLCKYTNQNQTICIRGIIYSGYEKWHRNIFFLVDRIDFIEK